MVLSDRGCGKTTALDDIAMMSLGGMGRSGRQWRELLESVGLRSKRIWNKEAQGLSVIEAVELEFEAQDFTSCDRAKSC